MLSIRKKEFDFLSNEAEYWTEQGIIDDEQKNEILDLYEIKSGSLTKILFIAGAIMLGLGAVSFALAHWHELPKFLRVCMILTGYAVSLMIYSITGRSQTKTGKSFLLIGSLIFGAGIYLIPRMYDIKLELSSILGWWSVQLIVSAVVFNDKWQTYLSQAVSLVYLNEINAIDIFALQFMNISKISFMEFFSPITAFILLAGLWLCWKRIDDVTALRINMLLTLLLLASRISLCFGGTWALLILSLCGGALSFCRFKEAEIMGLLMMGLFGLLLTWSDFWLGSFREYANILSILSAVICGCVMLLRTCCNRDNILCDADNTLFF